MVVFEQAYENLAVSLFYGFFLQEFPLLLHFILEIINLV